MKRELSLLGAVGLLALGCSSDANVDIGDAQKTGAALSDYAAHWDGYAEAYAFEDGSDRVRLSLDAAGNGFLEVGNSPPRPTSLEFPELSRRLRTGFQYPVVGASVQDQRLRLMVPAVALYRTWCEAQSPVAFGARYPGVYSCLPENEGLMSIDETTCRRPNGGGLVPCAIVYCSQVCQCTATSCTSGRGAAFQVREFEGLENGLPAAPFDASLSSESSLTGTLVPNIDERLTVRLERQ